jgi:putative FmdB family regulatory protein
MPLYEYECEVCGTTFEQMQHFGDPPVRACPQGHTQVRRVFMPAGIIFKGSGFYTTDYRRNGNGDGKDKSETKAEKKAEAQV